MIEALLVLGGLVLLAFVYSVAGNTEEILAELRTIRQLLEGEPEQ